MSVSHAELLISLLVDRLAGDRHVAVGAASPIPGAAALLAQAEFGAESQAPMQVTILHSRRYNSFTEGSRELFDCAAQGRIDSFFLGGVQIDGQANINLVGIGDYPTMKRRFPGSFGSALLYYVVPKVILFREEHSPRSLVPKVDFISAPGSSEAGVYRPGGPSALVTGRAVFAFDRDEKRFRLEQIHPGETAEGIKAATGFDYDPGQPSITPQPNAARLDLLRRRIAPKVAEFYPEFAAREWGAVAA
ncbi:MAG: CoA-transferase [Pseudomonadota bacterium]